MSLGINVLIELCKRAQALLGPSSILRSSKSTTTTSLDAPSGTALMIADAINAQAGGAYEYVYDRHTVRQKRGAQELGIASVRGGGLSATTTCCSAGRRKC